MPLKIAIVSQGKSKKPALEALIQEYKKRMQFSIALEEYFPKDIDVFLQKGGRKIALDPLGITLSSQNFSQKLFSCSESRLYFFIGGDEGFSKNFLEKVDEVISLSKMTFTHQFARAILIEQIYRASEIYKGSKYHK